MKSAANEHYTNVPIFMTYAGGSEPVQQDLLGPTRTQWDLPGFTGTHGDPPGCQAAPACSLPHSQDNHLSPVVLDTGIGGIAIPDPLQVISRFQGTQ